MLFIEISRSNKQITSPIKTDGAFGGLENSRVGLPFLGKLPNLTSLEL